MLKKYLIFFIASIICISATDLDKPEELYTCGCVACPGEKTLMACLVIWECNKEDYLL